MEKLLMIPLGLLRGIPRVEVGKIGKVFRIFLLWLGIGFILFPKMLVAQQTLNETLVHRGVTRQYFVYLPANYDGSTAVPLMFNFHGYTQGAGSHLNNTGMKAVADTAGFILVSPQGSLFQGSTHWNVGSWTQGSTADDLGFTEAMIDTLSSQYNIDQARVYSCGFSNGGYFNFELACQLSDRIAAIGSVGGTMSSQTFQACEPQRPVPILSIHGTSDPIVSYFGSQPVGSVSLGTVNGYWANHNNTELTPKVVSLPNQNPSDGFTVEYSSYQNGDNCTAVDHYKLLGAGHIWPGPWGNPDINASSVIWNFVSQYDINGFIGCTATTLQEFNSKKEQSYLYPNPTNSLVRVKIELLESSFCQIYDVNGRKRLVQEISPNHKIIDVSCLAPGFYTLVVNGNVMSLAKVE